MKWLLGTEAQPTRELLVALTGELSQIRRRGVDQIDFEGHNQLRLNLPEIELLIAGSPWASQPRPVAFRKFLTVAADYCSPDTTRRAARAFYGLGTYANLTAEDRQRVGLEELKIAPAASETLRKVQIRNVRSELARGLLEAAASGYRDPNPENDWDRPDVPILSSEGRNIEKELVALCEGRGVSPGKIHSLAPIILNLPGSKDEYRRALNTADPTECALRFLTCVLEHSIMKRRHYGPLVSYVLNTRGLGMDYEGRVARYMEVARVADESEFRRLEQRAILTYANELATLIKSPCEENRYRLEENLAMARGIFISLRRLDHEDHTDVLASLGKMYREEMPELAELLPELSEAHTPDDAAWFGKLMILYIGEYHVWINQYRDRLEPTQQFLDRYVLSLLLLDLGEQGDATRRTDYLARQYQLSKTDIELAGFEDVEHFPDVINEYIQARDASFALIAQMLNYNHNNLYWLRGRNISPASEPGDVPLFPMVRIDDLISDRVGVPN